MKTRKTKPQRLLKMCGAWSTAVYLKKRGYTIGQALALLGMANRFGLE